MCDVTCNLTKMSNKSVLYWECPGLYLVLRLAREAADEGKTDPPVPKGSRCCQRPVTGLTERVSRRRGFEAGGWEISFGRVGPRRLREFRHGSWSRPRPTGRRRCGVLGGRGPEALESKPGPRPRPPSLRAFLVRLSGPFPFLGFHVISGAASSTSAPV